MFCPRCAQPLVTHQASRVVLEGCSACGGVWLDGDASRRVVEAIDPAVIAEADRESGSATIPADVTRGAACPVCNSLMERMAIEQAGVVVDACRAHGVWFDRDELQRVIRAVAPRRDTPTPMAPPSQSPSSANQAPVGPPPYAPGPPGAVTPVAARPMNMPLPGVPPPVVARPPSPATPPINVPYIAGGTPIPGITPSIGVPPTAPNGMPIAPLPTPGITSLPSGVPYVTAPSTPMPNAAPTSGFDANPAARFFTDDSGAPSMPNAPGIPGPNAGPFGALGSTAKTAIAVGGGVAAVAGAGYLVTHPKQASHLFGEVGEVLSKLM